MRYFRLKILVFLLISLSGCVSPPPSKLVPVVDPMAVMLDKVIAQNASKPVGPEVPVALPKYGDRVTVSFLGDASNLLGDVVKSRGGAWKFTTTGPQPRLPIYVQVNAINVAFVDFMKDVAAQLGQRADIAMNGTTIELRYRSQN